MKMQDRTKTREKLEEELTEYRKLSRVQRAGRPWIREMRLALGMSVTELAHRLDCSRSLVYRIEEGEQRGEDRLETMQQVAEAMNCRVVYAIVPRDGETLEKTAERLKANPRWRTEKQEARKRKETDALSEKLNREHWEKIRKEEEERARARQRVADVEKLAEEWAAEKAQKAAAEKAKEAAEETGGYGVPAGWKPPAEWWTARTAKTMQKRGVPGDWALKTALERAGIGKAGSRDRE